ncbi:MAG: DMT family transporter [Anaerolineaceae bacterium]|nr:DMT family transporter [Anaerolineaceae bacterium]
MPKNRNNSTIAYIKLTTAIAIWGGSFIATKIAVQEVTPVTVVWLRFLIGIIILGYIAWKQKELVLPSWKDALELLWLGFLGITLHQWLQSSGLVTSDASTTAWLVSTSPIFMALLGWLFLKEKLSWQIITGFLMATIGVLLVVTKGDVQSAFIGNFGVRGNILILISAPNWALFSVLSRPILKRFSAIKVTFYVLFFGWLLTSVQFLVGRHWVELNQLLPASWASIAFLGVFCSAIAYIFYNDGVKALPASKVGVFLYLEPLVATTIAAAVLSESIMLASLAGGGLILLGVWFVNRNSEEDK